MQKQHSLSLTRVLTAALGSAAESPVLGAAKSQLARWARRSTSALAAFGMLTLSASSASAFSPNVNSDGSGAYRLGWPIDEVGTSYDQESGPVVVRINTLKAFESSVDGSANETEALSDELLAHMTKIVSEAISLWNNVPGSHFEFELGDPVEESEYFATRDYVLVTLGESSRYTDGSMGGSTNYHGSGTQLFINGVFMLNYDSHDLNSEDTYYSYLQTVTHELGHCLGLTHSAVYSYMSKDNWLQSRVSQSAIMSYGDDMALTDSVLHDDDIAGLSYLYPSKGRLKNPGGTIRGRLVDSASSPVTGARVFVVDSEGVIVSGVLSGINDYGKEGDQGGSFAISGLAPGSYTLVASSADSRNFQTHESGDNSWPSLEESDMHTAVASDTVIGAIAVDNNDVRMLGTIPVGTMKGLLKYHSELHFDALDGAASYRVIVRDHFTEEKVSVSTTETNVFVVRDLPKGLYMARVEALDANGARLDTVLKAYAFEFHPEQAVYVDDYAWSEALDDFAWDSVSATENGITINVNYARAKEKKSWDALLGNVTVSTESGEPAIVTLGVEANGDGNLDNWFTLEGDDWHMTTSYDDFFERKLYTLSDSQTASIKLPKDYHAWNDEGVHTVKVSAYLNGESVSVSFDVAIFNDVDGYMSDGSSYQSRVGYCIQDSDGDYVADSADAFPTDRTEWVDTDGDGIGNNADTDDDNDGVPDEQDALPEDPTESSDMDGDGIGDSSDDDIDGDGVANEEDAFPTDGTETEDSDGDGIGDHADPDDDNDGVVDLVAAAVSESSEERGYFYPSVNFGIYSDHVESAGLQAGDTLLIDGVSVTIKSIDEDRYVDATGQSVDYIKLYDSFESNLDMGTQLAIDGDDDGDGVANEDDAFPSDAAETVDSDGDGIGDNADTDDDNDGVLDIDEHVLVVAPVSEAFEEKGYFRVGLSYIGIYSDQIESAGLEEGDNLRVNGRVMTIKYILGDRYIDATGQTVSYVSFTTDLELELDMGTQLAIVD